jgi:hypothetical protein
MLGVFWPSLPGIVYGVPYPSFLRRSRLAKNNRRRSRGCCEPPNSKPRLAAGRLKLPGRRLPRTPSRSPHAALTLSYRVDKGCVRAALGGVGCKPHARAQKLETCCGSSRASKPRELPELGVRSWCRTDHALASSRRAR